MTELKKLFRHDLSHPDPELLPRLGPEWDAHRPDEHAEAVEQRVLAQLLGVDPAEHARAAAAQAA